MNRKIVFITCAVITVIITLASLITLKAVSGRTVRLVRIDKAKMAYDRADQFLQENMEDKAVSGFIIVLNQYSDSQYAEMSLRNLASIHSKKGDNAKAGYYYRRLLKDFPGIEDAVKIRSELEDSSMKRLLSPVITEDSLEYTVEPGDSLYVIAKRFNTTVELIKKINGLQSDIIKPGQQLKINVSRFSIFVDKSKKILVLEKDGEPFKTYHIATGKDGSTPAGTFTIMNKMIKPPWTTPEGEVIMPDSERYELGERWLGISLQGYGIHGTSDETVIGKPATAGCIRMRNNDVIELYDIVTEGAEIRIVEGAGKHGD